MTKPVEADNDPRWSRVGISILNATNPVGHGLHTDAPARLNKTLILIAAAAALVLVALIVSKGV